MKWLIGLLALALLLPPALARAQDERPTEPAPAPAPATPGLALPALRVQPFATIVGGVKLDTVLQAPTEHREGRVSTIALSMFGLRGSIGDLVTFESVLMANGGTSLHGSSAWEGQASLQVREQLVRVSFDHAVLEAGRVLDEASVNFVSAHVVDTLLQDTATRDPLLYSGLNLGNGVRATYEAVKGFRVGLTFTAGNPVSSTAALQVGGTFPPFDRFYIQPYQQVKQSPNNFPDDTFHMMLLSPAMMLSTDLVEARAEFQGYVVDTNTNAATDQNIKGYNVRGGVKLKLADEAIVPFANAAVDRNDTVTPTDVSKLAPDKYTSIVYGGGVDVNYARRFAGRANGVGAQYDRVQYQVGDGNVTNLHYINVGTTYWVLPQLAVGARFAMWLRNDVGVHDEGERSALLTMRLVL